MLIGRNADQYDLGVRQKAHQSLTRFLAPVTNDKLDKLLYIRYLKISFRFVIIRSKGKSRVSPINDKLFNKVIFSEIDNGCFCFCLGENEGL
jgi:hypothetical protein